ncbi:MAG: protein tyrosine phosphatase family protein [Xenococcaceae cyanobacterium MO_207.B15]|nr:protein tyrosine phosphatase family protein [Xenococcaceae cyanobacterium MO_207.B15]
MILAKLTNPVKTIINFLKLSLNRYLGVNFMGNKLENIFNFLQLTDSIATAGQPTKKQLSLVKDSGYKTIINLATSASENALPDEKETVEALGMKYIHIPIDFNNPTSEDFAEFCQAMQDNNQQPLLIHCAANLRVSAFMYIYRLTQENFDSEQAKRDLSKVWTPNETWQQFIDSQLTK